MDLNRTLEELEQDVWNEPLLEACADIPASLLHRYI